MIDSDWDQPILPVVDAPYDPVATLRRLVFLPLFALGLGVAWLAVVGALGKDEADAWWGEAS